MVVLHMCPRFPLCHTDTLLLPGGSDLLHALQMGKRRQRKKGDEGEKLATRGNLQLRRLKNVSFHNAPKHAQKEEEMLQFLLSSTFFFLHSGLTVAIAPPRASASLVYHWHLSEQKAQEEYL